MSIRKINYTVIAPEVEQDIKDKYTKSETDNLLNQKEDKVNKGVANGYAGLDANAKVPLAQLPDIAKQRTYVVNGELERNSLSNIIEGERCFEVSTGDSYIWSGSEWLITSKADWENINLQWANIVDKPSSSVSEIDDTVSRKHGHNNLSLLEAITQTLVDRWNSAWDHISDSIKHITSTERTLWNSVSNKANQSDLSNHTNNNNIHVTTTDKNNWNNKAEINMIPTNVSDLTNDSGYISDISSKADLTYVNNQLNNKVDKVSGKGLSTEDYTTAEKNKLTNIQANANNYVHPSSSGNKHIPSGGSSGQFLKWSSDGTAVWESVAGGLELGEISSTAYRGDRGKIAYDHSQSAHAPANAGLIIP